MPYGIFLSLTYFTQYDNLWVHPCLCKWHHFILFNVWVTLHYFPRIRFNSRDLSLILGLGRSPEEGKGYPFQYSGLENSMGCIDHGVTKSRTGLSGFHFQPSIVSVYDIFIHSSADEHLGCFHVLATVKSAAVNTGVHISFWTMFFSSQDLNPRSGIAGSYGSSVSVSRSVVSDSLWPHGLQPIRLLCPWDSPGKNTGAGCHW